MQAEGDAVARQGRTSRGEELRLRSPAPDEPRLDIPSEFEEWGDRDAPRVPELGRLVVEVAGADGSWVPVGEVSWHAEYYGPSSGSKAWNIGIGIAASARGRGIGSTAQRLLAEWLLETTSAHRVEASTDVANAAEQGALRAAGFSFEGVLRAAQMRADGIHDLQVWSRIREA